MGERDEIEVVAEREEFSDRARKDFGTAGGERDHLRWTGDVAARDADHALHGVHSSISQLNAAIAIKPNLEGVGQAGAKGAILRHAAPREDHALGITELRDLARHRRIEIEEESGDARRAGGEAAQRAFAAGAIGAIEGKVAVGV